MSIKLGDDVINYYKSYRNDKDCWKTVTRSGIKFHINDRYEIIDISILVSFI